MKKKPIAITGAFSYTGKYIAKRLLAEGHSVITLTGSLHREDRPDPFDGQVPAYPFNFDDPEQLAASLAGIPAPPERESDPVGPPPFVRATSRTPRRLKPMYRNRMCRSPWDF